MAFMYAERRAALADSASASIYSTNAMQSMRDQLGTRVRHIAHIGRPLVEINLDGGEGAYVTSYSTMDTVSGTVTVIASTDTRFDDVEITFQGEAKTRVERLATTPSGTGHTESKHRFLNLKQPISESDLPHPRILQAGKPYTFSFAFTLPTQLLPRACSHKISSDHVRDMHLMLPPSLGDPDLAGHGGALLDDLAPDMTKIQYTIKARITQLFEAANQTTVLADKTRKIRVKPAFEEQPPLNTDINKEHSDASESEYRVRAEKSIRKGLFKGKSGTLIMASAQPKPLLIPGARASCDGPITTVAKVRLRFDPADQSSIPPRLGSLASRLKVWTFFASTPRVHIPRQNTLGYDVTQGAYQHTVNLSSLCVGSAQWEKHTASSDPNLSRRDSGISDCSTESGPIGPSKHYQGHSYYTAEILVPIALPTNKHFVATFHSCLISRVYSLHLSLSVHAPGVTDPSLSVKLPIQICAEASESGAANARARNAEMGVHSEVDSVFTPRGIAPPTSQQGHADEPPSYAMYAPRRSRRFHRQEFSVAV